jgi:hypothetical protein
VKTPKLSAKKLKDQEALGDAIDKVLLASKPWQKTTKKVQKAGHKLRRLASYDAWMMYLSLEEIVNERAAVENGLLVRWAFEQGRRRRP